VVEHPRIACRSDVGDQLIVGEPAEFTIWEGFKGHVGGSAEYSVGGTEPRLTTGGTDLPDARQVQRGACDL
jgi:hypothetical protein